MKIEIKNRAGEVLFTHKEAGNTIWKTLESAIASGKELIYANLIGAFLSRADLKGANMPHACLDSALIGGANLKGANLKYASLKTAKLEGVCLKDSNLRGSNLEDADLRNADLRNADLSESCLRGVDIRGANTDGAIYGEATLSKGLLQLLGYRFDVFYFDDHIEIGCELLKTSRWSNLSDEDKSSIDDEILEFFEDNKTLILSIAIWRKISEF